MKTVVTLSVLCSALLFHTAQASELPVPPLAGGEPVAVDNAWATRVFFDCTEGNGNLVVRAYDVFGNQETQTIYVGAGKGECEAQAAPLRKNRSVASVPSAIAVCAAGSNLLLRWIAYPALSTAWMGYPITQQRKLLVPAGRLPYSTRAKCLAYAAELNGDVAAE